MLVTSTEQLGAEQLVAFCRSVRSVCQVCCRQPLEHKAVLCLARGKHGGAMRFPDRRGQVRLQVPQEQHASKCLPRLPVHPGQRGELLSEMPLAVQKRRRALDRH